MPSSSLPDSITQSIEISNAKSIGEQPAILANMALAQQIFNQNLQQQMAISAQQALNQIVLATTAKCASLILEIDPADASSRKEHLARITELVDLLKSLQAGALSSTLPASATSSAS